MARRGRNGPMPDPTPLKVLKGYRKDRINFAEPIPEYGMPEPPEWLTGIGRAMWIEHVERLDKMLQLSPIDGPALAVMFNVLNRYVEASHIVASSSVLIKGRNGNLVKNPAVGSMRDAEIAFLSFAREFGMTPSARSLLRDPRRMASNDERERLLSG
jgi:P27 family predicted phage terminase small subunit